MLATGAAILLITFIKTNQISLAMILATIFFMIVKYSCLNLVQSTNSRLDTEVQNFLTIFSWFLFIPIYATSVENLIEPTLSFFIRFCAIIELTFVLMAICVIFTVGYQSKKDYTAQDHKNGISGL